MLEIQNKFLSVPFTSGQIPLCWANHCLRLTYLSLNNSSNTFPIPYLSSPGSTGSSMAKASLPDDEESSIDDSDVMSDEDSNAEETEQAQQNANGKVLEVDNSVSLKESGLLDLLSDNPKTDILKLECSQADLGVAQTVGAESHVFELQEPLKW